MTPAAQLLTPGSPVRVLAASEPLGCCCFVSAWVLALAGRIPAGDTLNAWARAAPQGWWARANLWPPAPPWENLDAYRELVGGDLFPAGDVGEVPPLVVDRWHIAQEWSAGFGTGHTYIVSPSQVLHDSAYSRGYRERSTAWPRRKNRAVGLLVLPGGV